MLKPDAPRRAAALRYAPPRIAAQRGAPQRNATQPPHFRPKR
jgi:hypothetical protein